MMIPPSSRGRNGRESRAGCEDAPVWYPGRVRSPDGSCQEPTPLHDAQGAHRAKQQPLLPLLLLLLPLLLLLLLLPLLLLLLLLLHKLIERWKMLRRVQLTHPTIRFPFVEIASVREESRFGRGARSRHPDDSKIDELLRFARILLAT